MKQSTFALTVATFLMASGSWCRCHAQEPIVPGFQRFFQDDKSNKSQGGQLLLGELNCTSCHASTDGAVQPKQAPILDHVGSRVRVSYLKKFLSDPQAVKPGTTMPHLFADDADKGQKIEALVHFLAFTGSVRHERSDLKAVSVGRDLFSKVGCVACHGPHDANGQSTKTLPNCVPLGDLKAKYSITTLAAFLENPLLTRPGGRMPHILKAKEGREVAHYLIQGIKGDLSKGATNFAYYEGEWNKVPDFDKLKPVKKGTGSAFDLGVTRRGGNYALRFEGHFKIDRDGIYRFHLNSDDGSNLYINGKKVVNNDGVHPPKSVAGTIKLKKGTHKVLVGFFQVGGGAELDVEVEGPGLARQPLGGLVAATEAALEQKPPPPKQDDPDFLPLQPALVAKGRELFSSVGCASCHQMTVDNKILRSPQSLPLAKLGSDNGCLSAKPSMGKPWYGLSAGQRKSLVAALKTPPKLSKEPTAVIARTMTTFNCYACHARAKVGGPTEELNKFFLTAQQEMGDEGRLPPPLDGVGAKINPDYLKILLDKGVHDRPYMHTQMPGFGSANVRAFAEAVAAIDKIAPAPRVEIAESMAKTKAGGRHLVGALGTGCIKCHTFGGLKAEGIQGIDMLALPKRLTRDWFHAYLLDPQRVRPGTRMPASWSNGQTFYPKLLGGKTENQIEAIWVYLLDGKQAQIPIGMGKQSIPLNPLKSAIIYRNFIQGAGSRGIAVGYPEHVSLAFDANEIRMAMIWQGAFIDAAKHWTDRGVGFEGPLGDNILKLPSGVPFASLSKADAVWPATPAKEQGYKFIGYRLNAEDRPTFLYSFSGLRVEDFPNGVAGKEPSLLRTLTLTTEKAPEHLYFRAAVGNKIEALGQGWYRVDGYRMRIETNAEPQVRQSAGKAELVVPMRFRDGKAQVVQEIVW